MKNKLLIIAVVVLAAVVVWFYQDPLKAIATSTFTEARSSVTGINGVSTSTLPFNNVTNNGTTTRSYIAVGNASTTLTANIGSADEVWMFLHIVASTSASTLRYQVE